MKYNDIKRARAFVSGAASLSVIDADGEVMFETSLPHGFTDLVEFRQLLPTDGHIEVEGDAVVMVPSTDRVKRIKYGAGAYDSGANPDFRVTAATRYEREMRLALDQLERSNQRLERKMASISKAREVVSEDRVAPEPEPQPAPDDNPNAQDDNQREGGETDAASVAKG